MAEVKEALAGGPAPEDPFGFKGMRKGANSVPHPPMRMRSILPRGKDQRVSHNTGEDIRGFEAEVGVRCDCIKDVDKAEHPIITVMTCGRASFYLTTLDILLGCNVRVGKEDTINIIPHSNDVPVSNKDIVKQTAAIARLLGGEPMTGPVYREALGMRPLK